MNIQNFEELTNAIKNLENELNIIGDISFTHTITINHNLNISGNNHTFSWATERAFLSMFDIKHCSVNITQLNIDGNDSLITLLNFDNSTATLTNTIIKNCRQPAISALNSKLSVTNALITEIKKHGNAVFLNHSVMDMYGNSEISHNTSSAINMTYESTLTMHDNSVIVNNSSIQSGGAIIADISSVIIDGNINTQVISGNTTQYYGGALYACDSSVVLSNADINNNNSANMGGAIALNNSNLFVSQSVLSSNIAGTVGGAIYVAETSKVSIVDNSSMYDNKASMGGAIYNNADVVFDDVTLTNNDSTNNGGAIYNTGNIKFESGSINNNSSDNTGGGVYNLGVFDFSGGIIEENTATIHGPGFGNSGIMFLSGDVRIDDGLYISSYDYVPILSAPLNPNAHIVLNSSDYIAVRNHPLIVANTTDDYFAQDSDAAAFVLPDDFFGYEVVVTDDLNHLITSITNFTLTYNNTFGVTNLNPTSFTVYDGDIILLDLDNRDEYEFDCWLDTSGDIIKDIVCSQQKTDITLYASWKALKIYRAIIYLSNLNNTIYLPNATIAYSGSTAQISNQIPYRYGYIFIGWNTDANGNGSRYYPGQSIIMPDYNLRLYAIWKKVSDNNENKNSHSRKNKCCRCSCCCCKKIIRFPFCC